MSRSHMIIHKLAPSFMLGARSVARRILFLRPLTPLSRVFSHDTVRLNSYSISLFFAEYMTRRRSRGTIRVEYDVVPAICCRMVCRSFRYGIFECSIFVEHCCINITPVEPCRLVNAVQKNNCKHRRSCKRASNLEASRRLYNELTTPRRNWEWSNKGVEVQWYC